MCSCEKKGDLDISSVSYPSVLFLISFTNVLAMFPAQSVLAMRLWMNPIISALYSVASALASAAFTSDTAKFVIL